MQTAMRLDVDNVAHGGASRDAAEVVAAARACRPRCASTSTMSRTAEHVVMPSKLSRLFGRRDATARKRDAAYQHVVITGAAGAIGSSVARAMHAAWPGVRLSLVDRVAPTALARELGAHELVADLLDLASLPALIDRIRERAPIDGLVNCAGVMRVRDVATWRWDDGYELLAIDLLAPLQLQQLVVPAMVSAGRGLVVNVSSMAGRVPLRGCAFYGAAKAGLAMASEIARADLAGRGVQVLTVYPGPVRSALEAGARADYGGAGLFGRFAPTGDPDELATRILRAIADNEPRVVYPRAYGVGWTAPNLSRWLALGYGPPPIT